IAVYSSYVPSSTEEVVSLPKDDADKKAIEQPACSEGLDTASSSFGHLYALEDHSKMTNLEDTGIFDDAYDDRIEAIRLFLAFASFMDFTVYQIDVKSVFLYGTIEEEVYVRSNL
ncbi:putative ribonuclease H-like domain-containing protein, partial [Tanacetum coccineum]